MHNNQASFLTHMGWLVCPCRLSALLGVRVWFIAAHTAAQLIPSPTHTPWLHITFMQGIHPTLLPHHWLHVAAISNNLRIASTHWGKCITILPLHGPTSPYLVKVGTTVRLGIVTQPHVHVLTHDSGPQSTSCFFPLVHQGQHDTFS